MGWRRSSKAWEIAVACEDLLKKMREEACQYTLQDTCIIANDHGDEERKELNKKVKEYLEKGGKIKRHPEVFAKGGWTFNNNRIRGV